VHSIRAAIKSNGGFVWACKNYDGDVQSGQKKAPAEPPAPATELALRLLLRLLRIHADSSLIVVALRA